MIFPAIPNSKIRAKFLSAGADEPPAGWKTFFPSITEQSQNSNSHRSSKECTPCRSSEPKARMPGQAWRKGGPVSAPTGTAFILSIYGKEHGPDASLGIAVIFLLPLTLQFGILVESLPTKGGNLSHHAGNPRP
jgi:hypothetical protein